MNIFYRVFLSFAILLCIPVLSGCSGDEPNPTPDKPGEVVYPEKYETTVLIYAVASNNLSYDLKNDMEEIYEGASQIEGLNDKVAVFLYSVLPNEKTATLSRLVPGGDDYTFETIKEYDRNVYSTDPRRISEVIADVDLIAPADNKGVIFWSHGLGWTPAFSDHEVVATEVGSGGSRSVTSSVNSGQQKVELPELTGWYGQDTYLGKSDYCDIHELASAIPDNHFSFIWFDCCFMSGIELIYQLRDKCDTLVAYPTEIMAEGMPYTLTIPLIAKSSPDLVGASKALADYYNDKLEPFTIFVADMNQAKIERLADASKSILSDKVSPPVANLMRYSRLSFGPYFDFGQFMVESANPRNEDYDARKNEFTDALKAITIFKDASKYDFRGDVIPVDIYSGVSVHYIGLASRDKEEYYKTLDWYKRVYPQE